MHNNEELDGVDSVDVCRAEEHLECIEQGASFVDPTSKFGFATAPALVLGLARPPGQASFGRKKDVVYAVDEDGSPKPVTVTSNPFGPKTIQFNSVYYDLREPCDAVPTQYPLLARHDRIVKHPVSVGCIKAAGLPIAPPKATQWSLYWGARWPDVQYQQLRATSSRRVNHFPKTYLIGRKDNLARALQRACRRYGAVFKCHPCTYFLPSDRVRLEREMKQHPDQLWIFKPAALSRGRGIQCFRAHNGIPEGETGVDPESEGEPEANIVQQYLVNPLLINGFKVDFRIYCVVTSFDPLLIYVYNEGLVRFATERFATDGDLSQFAHLTNFSINKKNGAFVKPGEYAEESASKWTLHACQQHFAAHNMDWEKAWLAICRAVVAGVVAVAEDVASATNDLTCRRFGCFELYGVDVMLTESLEANLIEFNVLPSLGCGSALDKHIKGHLVADTLTLVGVPVGDEEWNDLITSGLWPTSVDDPKANTDAAKRVLAETENQLARCRGFSRVFPSVACADFLCCSSKPTQLVHSWDQKKATMSPSEKEQAIGWLRGELPQLGLAKQLAERPRRLSVAPAPRFTERVAKPKPRAENVPPPARLQPTRPVGQAKVMTAPIPVKQFLFVDVK
jgi:hypothetical protein